MKTQEHTKKANPFDYSDADLYWLMRREGNRRFGSECKHERTIGGHCVNCKRRVVVRLSPNAGQPDTTPIKQNPFPSLLLSAEEQRRREK